MIHKAITTLIKQIEADVYPGSVPQTAKLPFVNHFLVSTDFNPTKDGNSLKDIRYQVSVFAKLKDDCVTLSDQIRVILDEFSGNVSGCIIDQMRIIDENDLYEEEAGVYHRAMDFRIRYK